MRMRHRVGNVLKDQAFCERIGAPPRNPGECGELQGTPGNTKEAINRFTWGWVGYYRLASVKAQFDTVDQWIRRRLRKILWEQWRTPKTRCRKLIALGLERQRARKATATGLGAWWNAGASHMHAAVNNRVLAPWGLRSLLDQHRAMQRSA